MRRKIDRLDPVAALIRAGCEWAVFVASNGRVAQPEVNLGARTSIDAWIKEGLQPGERGIVYPIDSVAEDKRIRVVRGR